MLKNKERFSVFIRRDAHNTSPENWRKGGACIDIGKMRQTGAQAFPPTIIVMQFSRFIAGFGSGAKPKRS